MSARVAWVLICALSGALPLAQAQAQAQARKPLKVFVLIGQSNMQGHAHVRTLDDLARDEAGAELLTRIRQPDGQPRVHEQVRIAYRSQGGVKRGALTTGFGADGNKLGPELTFGVRLQERLGEPIVLLKAAWGGKSLHTDFRPPSGGPFVFRPEQLEQLRKRGQDVAAIQAEKKQATGHYYRQTVEFVRDELSQLGRLVPGHEGGYELAGIVWFQGWNDMVDGGVYPQRYQPGGYDAYTQLLVHLIKDLRKDLEAPQAPFVIGVMGVGGPTADYGPKEKRYAGVHQHFRDAMAAPAKLQPLRGNVSAVLTEKAWDPELAALQARDKQTLSDEERELLDKGVSNRGFHYLGSARILGGIGVLFADAMAELQRAGGQQGRRR